MSRHITSVSYRMSLIKRNLNCQKPEWKEKPQKETCWASLVAQWIKIHLLKQETHPHMAWISTWNALKLNPYPISGHSTLFH